MTKPVGTPVEGEEEEEEEEQPRCAVVTAEDIAMRKPSLLRALDWIDWAWSGQPASIPFSIGLMLGLMIQGFGMALYEATRPEPRPPAITKGHDHGEHDGHDH